ncbi:kinase-like protein [Coniochaeta sp. 2T2.1]|nr:kinase-like protein [Coniochaeta sp. 2T2.1]
MVDHEGCLPTPPLSPIKGSKHKSSFTQRISRVNTLFRGPFDGSSNHKNKQKDRRSIKSHRSAETSNTVETSKTDTGSNGSSEKKALNHGTIITRQLRSSPEGNLAPIEEAAFDYANATILTVERAAAAKIYLETHFNNLLATVPSPKTVRQRKFESELHRRMRDENFTPEQQEQMRADFYRRETQHLREQRVMKARSIRARIAGKGDPAARLDDEYEILKILGKGSFGVVRLVREKSSADLYGNGTPGSARKQVYAMKVIRKSDMLRTSQEGHLRAERDFLVASEGSDWIVPLVASFQDAANLYLVMEYMPGGDFLGLLIRENILHETVARFYIAEMIVCIEAAHALKCIHRDVKPDNFLISASGHLKISDFGLAFDGHWSHDMAYFNSHRYSLVHKLGIAVEGDEQDKEEARSVQATLKWTTSIMSGMEKHNKKNSHDGEPLLNWRNRCGNRTSAMSVVGTSQYMAPEVVAGKPYDARCDWWSIGVILYECIYGHTPFLSDEGRQMTKHNILRHRETLGFPAHPAVSHRCRQLMEALIRDKEDRLSSKHYKIKDLTTVSSSFANIASSSSNRANKPGTAGPSSSLSFSCPKDFSGRYVFPNDAEDIKAHKWFRGIPWDRLHQLQPPFVPRIRSVDDTHYFDEEDEISDWSDSRPSSTTAATPFPEDNSNVVITPTILRTAHYHPISPVSHHHAAASNTALSSPSPSLPQLDPHNATPTPTTTTTTTTSTLFYPQPTIPPPLLSPPPTSTSRAAKEDKARLFLRGLTRSMQKWALAAITLPYDSSRVQAQLEGLPGLDAGDRARLRYFVRLFGRKDRKRPRDRLLRDKSTRGVVMDVRRKTAFLGYTWRRMRPPPVEEEGRGGVVDWAGDVGEERVGVGMGGGGVDGMFEREGLRHGFAGCGYVGGGGVGGGGFGDEYDYGYGAGWDARGVGGYWDNVSAVKAMHGKGRFSWR